MFPEFQRIDGYLPLGIHKTTWDELSSHFGNTPKRKELFEGLLRASYALSAANVTELYIDGSFATAKRNPSDWDACYSGIGVDDAKLDPVFFDFTNQRAAQKAKYFGEVFPAEMSANSLGEPYKQFFQKDKNGRPKGIICLDLRTLP